MSLENFMVPLAYAQEGAAKAGEPEKFVSLLTDTEPVGMDPYIGQGRGVKSLIPALTNENLSNLSANVSTSARVHKLAKESYRPNEDIKVVIENGLNKKFKTEFIDATGNKVFMETTEIETGAAKVITVEQPSSFRPGKYRLRITDSKGAVSEQDFSWGVLAVNPDKSIYAPNETANLAIGVLDDKGNMVCDAQVELQITDPQGKMTSLSTDKKQIVVNPECISHDFTLKPDYETNYKVNGTGIYKMLLKAQTKNGAYSINDAFEVRNNVPFDVKRITATRIYPPNQYPVTMEITANQDFEGTIAETVPASFKIARPGNHVQTDAEEVDEIVNASASPSGILAPESQLPEGPAEVAGIQTQAAVLPFSTINNLVEISGAERAVLSAKIPGLGMPFSGPFPVSQEFGESLVKIHDADLYSSFGMHGHDGVDFAMPEGTPIQAVDGGKVAVAGDGDYGTTVVIQHSWGKSYYGHLSALDVKVGDEVPRGATIARAGNTGISTGPHLHFSIKPEDNDGENGYYGKVDPAYYLGLKQTAGVVLAAATKLQPENTYMPTSTDTDVQVLTWKVSVKKGDKIKIGYNYLAPKISPQFYTLGPATFTDTSGKEIFHEIRKWQIASDALELKFKVGNFNKVTCTATCNQTVTGVGFKPKAVIFEWTLQTASGSAANQFMGMGFATNDSSAIQERALSYWAEDNQTTSDTGKIRSNTKTIVMQNTNGAKAAEADLVSFDADGFTLGWTTNDTNAYIIRYKAIGGADVTNAKAGSFTLASSGASQAVTDPGFKPDFVMFMSNGGGIADTESPTASMSAGFASSPTNEGVASIMAEDNNSTNNADSCRQQRTNVSILLLIPDGTGANNCGSQNASADLASFDTNGFTLNVTDTPLANVPIYYLAIKGGQHTVGSFSQPTVKGPQSVTAGFRPSGVSLLSANTNGTSNLTSTASLSMGGASLNPDSLTMSNWCNDTTGTVGCTASWSARRKITFDNSAATEDLTNFPVLVKVDANRIDYAKTQTDVDDIRFVDPSDPNTVLPSEREGPSTSSGTNYFWVKVPSIPAGSRTDYIYMYYGNSTVPIGDDVSNVWDSNYRAVYHLDESGSTTTISDSTSNANNGTKGASGAPNPITTGPIGPAQDFDGTDDWVRVNDSASLDLAANGTVSVWYNRDGTGTADALVSKGTSSANNNQNYQMMIGSGNDLDVYLSDSTTNVQIETVLSMQPTSTTLDYFHAYTWDGARVRLFTNGENPLVDNVPDLTTFVPAGNAGNLRIGENAATTNPFNGIIDEVRISNTPRSPSWMKAEYLSGTDAMNTYGVEEAGPQASEGSQTFSEGSIWSDFRDNEATNDNANMSTSSIVSILMATSLAAASGAAPTNAEASMNTFDQAGFTLNWTKVDATSREILYWAAGSVTATQEDYRWYKNTNGITPTKALEDENSSTIIPTKNPYVRLRTNFAVGGNGLNASTQGFKLQYAAAGSETAVGGTNDWCNDTTGVTCTAPGEAESSSANIDWCNDTTGVTCTSSWQYRRKITFNNSASTTNLTDFPVMVKLDGSRIDYTRTQNSGQDIRFVDPSNPNVALNHEIEGTWTESGTSYVWVKVPQLDALSKSDYIWMYYGNSSASAPATELGTTAHATGVWDTNFRSVFHLSENPTITNCPTTKEVCDSTTNAVNMDANSMESGDQIAGKAGGSLNFDGVAEYLNAASSPIGAAPTGNITFTAWLHRSGALPTGSEPIQISEGLDPGGGTSYVEFYIDTDPFPVDFGSRATGFGAQTATTATNTNAQQNKWMQVTGTVSSGGVMRIYINGQDVSGSTPNLSTLSGLDTMSIGAALDNGGSSAVAAEEFWTGQIDEVRISNTARSADWINAEYLTTNDQMNTYDTSEYSYSETVQNTTGWGYRKKITFNNSASTTALSNFPVLVKLDSSDIDYSKVKPNGQDLRFVDPSDRTTVLPHEIESWNPGGYSYVWVSVPQVDAASASDYIYMYYGNPGAPDGQNASGVWSNGGFAAVWHLKENPATTCSSTKEICDSTSNAYHGDTNGTMGAEDSVETKVYKGLDYDSATSDYTSIGNITQINSVTKASVSMWAKRKNPESRVIATKENSTDGFGVQVWSDGKIYFVVADNGAANGTFSNSDTDWHLLTMVYDGSQSGNAGKVKAYMDGQPQTLTFTGTVPTATPDGVTATTFALGRDGQGSNYANGQQDEVRVAATDRSPDYVKADYLTQTDQFNSFGQEQPYTNGGTTTVGWTDVGSPWCNDATDFPLICNTSWSSRKTVTIDNRNSSTALTNFPVLVKLNSSRIDYTKTQNSGQDIRFVDPADNTTVLPHEIETWNESGDSYVWVRVPQLDAGAMDSIIMYYGNAAIASGQDATNVWTNSYTYVWHLNDAPTSMQDSTSSNNDGNVQGSATSTIGKMGNAINFDGVNDYISTTTQIAGPQNFTTAVWFKTPSPTGKKIVGFEDGQTGTAFNSYDRTTYIGDDGKIRVHSYDGSNKETASTNTMVDNTWHYSVGTYDDTNNLLRLYSDGRPDSSIAAANAEAGNGYWRMGSYNTGALVQGTDGYFQGQIDEVRISSVVRSADWVQAEYLTMQDVVNTYGTEESQTTALWSFKDNSNVTDRTTITASLLSTAASGNQMTYQESNPTIVNPTALAVGEKREFDFSLDGSRTSPRRTYYFRLVDSEGTPFTNYTRYPAITVGVPNQKVMRGGKFFNYKQSQPFTF